MSFKEITLHQNKADWKLWRHNGVGASDIPIILGKSKYKTRSRLLMEKIEEEPPEEKDHYIAKLGHHVEPKVRGYYNLLNNTEFKPRCVQHEEISWARASLDGLYSACVWECKFIGKDKFKEIKKGKVPEEFLYQINWQLFITKCSIAKLCVVNLEKIKFKSPIENFYIKKIEDDVLLQYDVLFPAAKAFWNEVLMKRRAMEEAKNIPLSEAH